MRIITLPIAWLIGIITVVAMGFRPAPYLQYVRQIPPPHPYPMYTVLWIAFLLTAHVGAVFAALRPRSYRYSWGRALLALLISLGFLVFAALGAMHAPPAHIIYVWWLLGFGICMLSLLIWSIACAGRGRLSLDSFNRSEQRRAD
jgi:hypothetical protein